MRGCRWALCVLGGQLLLHGFSWLAGRPTARKRQWAGKWLALSEAGRVVPATARAVFTSKSSSVLWIQGHTWILDKVCLSPEFETLRPTVDKSFPLEFLQEPWRDRRGAARAFICGGGNSRTRCFSINRGV